MLVILCIR